MIRLGQRRKLRRPRWLGQQGENLIETIGGAILLGAMLMAFLYGPQLFAPEPGEGWHAHFCIHCEAR